MTAPRRLLAIDPGLPDLGAAVYEDGVLAQAVHVVIPREQKERADAIVQLCDATERALGIHGLALGDDRYPDLVVAEWPQIFLEGGSIKRREGRTVTVQQYLELAGVSAVMLDRAASWGAEVARYRPAEWKGNKPKPEHQRTGLAQLSDDERARLPKMPKAGRYLSDPLDAALLGLWWLHRAGARTPRFYARPIDFIDLVEK